MIKKIYLDMDGVLCDFHKRYQELFGYKPGGEGRENERDRKEFSSNFFQNVWGKGLILDIYKPLSGGSPSIMALSKSTTNSLFFVL